MAGIIISEASAQNNALFGEVQYPIASFLESRFEAAEQESIAAKITRKVNSTHAREGYAGMGSMDDFLPTVENGDYPHTDMKVAYTKDIKNITWKNSFSVSKEMLDDSNFKEIFKRAAGLVKRYHSTRENFFMELLGTALQGKNSFMRNGIEIDATAYDKLPMFSTGHKGETNKIKLGNAFSDEFSEDALGELATRMQNFTDEKGHVLNIQPDTILIANDAALKKQVFSVIGSEKVTGSGNNDYNYLFGNWTVLVSPILNRYLKEGSKPWVLLDSKMIQDEDIFIMQDREALNVTSLIERNDANTWNGRCRFGGGFVDFRGMIAGGLDFGEAL